VVFYVGLVGLLVAGVGVAVGMSLMLHVHQSRAFWE